MKLKRIIPTFFTTALVIGSGCAYYSTSSSYLPSHLKNIAIPNFANETYEQGISESITELIIDKFMADGRLHVTNKKNADAILDARIISLEDVPFTLGKEERAEHYKVVIMLDIAFRDLTTNQVIWENTRLETWETYQLIGATDREAALESAIEKLAADIINQTLSGW